MKRPKGNRVLYFANIVFALLLLLFYATSFISPKTFELGGLLNLFTPVIFIINMLFAVFWLVKLNRYVLISLITLLLGWSHVRKFVKLSSSVQEESADFKIMSYNVMQFYSPTDKSKNTYKDIDAFITKVKPDIIGIQEYTNSLDAKFLGYKYKVQNGKYEKLKTVILSKHKIIDHKLYEFVSNNSGLSADIVVDADTIRVFSVHFESLNLMTDLEEMDEKSLRRKYKRLKRVFPRQVDQFDLIKNDIINSPYPVVVCSDLNNTSLSYIYRKLLNLELKDSFLEKGCGYGKTFTLNSFPLRIDMVFTSNELMVASFDNFEVKHSDHYPIMASLKVKPSDK